MRCIRPVLILGAVVCAVFVTCGTARAVSEFCPASAGTFTRIGDASSTLYSFTVDAEGPRSVSGDIVVKADNNWYQISFPQTPLTVENEMWRDNHNKLAYATYSSVPLYVRLPIPVKAVHAYVSDAKAVGDQYFNWDVRGDVGCSAPAGFGSFRGHERRTDLDKPPAADAVILIASAIPIPGSLDCPTPFSPATVTNAVAPSLPSNALYFFALTEDDGRVLVEILIDANGKLADAWIYGSSGSKDFDDAALAAARQSTYAAGTAFCKPAPGQYLFHAEFVRPERK